MPASGDEQPVSHGGMACRHGQDRGGKDCGYCLFAWTTQTRCPHTHSRRKSSSRKLLDLKDKGRQDHTLTSAILGPRSGVHFSIRKTIFGTNNGLTKVSLFLMDTKLKPFVLWHHALNAKLADISCVLLHFPFVNSFYTKVVEAVESGRYGYVTTDEYRSYLSGLQKSPQFHLKLESAKKLPSVD